MRQCRTAFEVHVNEEITHMPQVKKTPARARRSDSASPAPTSPITRREVEQAAERFEKALEEANQALHTLARNVGKGAEVAYKDLSKALKTLRRDAEKTNRQLSKDLAKLAAVASPAKAPGKPARNRAAPSPRPGTAAKDSGAPRGNKA
jgi:superfamily II RNA helicase